MEMKPILYFKIDTTLPQDTVKFEIVYTKLSIATTIRHFLTKIISQNKFSLSI